MTEKFTFIEDTYTKDTEIAAAIRVDGARLEERLALPSGGYGDEGKDSDNSGFEKLHLC